MLRRLVNRLQFELERFVVRSALHRLLFIALVIGLVSIVGGLLARRTTRTSFKGDSDAIWWAFLRLADPGYLGDDQGVALRAISTVVTVLGYVVFLGALVAIMTQWLNTTMTKLESGLTPIAANNHIVILGYSNRTAAIVRELLVSEGRVSRFLDARGGARSRIVILAESVTPEVVQELNDRLGPLWNARQVTLRLGTPLRIDHLRRVDFLHAAAILASRRRPHRRRFGHAGRANDQSAARDREQRWRDRESRPAPGRGRGGLGASPSRGARTVDLSRSSPRTASLGVCWCRRFGTRGSPRSTRSGSHQRARTTSTSARSPSSPARASAT